MNLHEYQAKQLFGEYDLPVSRGFAVDSGDEAAEATKKLGGGNGIDFVPVSNNKESNNG